MKILVFAVVLTSILALHNVALAYDDDHSRDKKRWWGGTWNEEYWDGPCEVKIEKKRGEFKREIKCKDGVGARWRGEWKKEFRDGRCWIKQEATREEFKEEVKCD